MWAALIIVEPPGFNEVLGLSERGEETSEVRAGQADFQGEATAGRVFESHDSIRGVADGDVRIGSRDGTPLNVILGKAESLLKQTEDETTQASLQSIIRQVERLIPLRQQLCALPMSEPPAPESRQLWKAHSRTLRTSLVSQTVARKARFEVRGSMFRKPRTSDLEPPSILLVSLFPPAL